ncbi:hypothetical protein P4H39_00330 [Paenibacillus lautus]|uniref:hypothetical protein n=1 Tax=Paenibacillus lautus TaxID=1401 RepID=UPI002DB9D707|nr:hypothetical protein [Paenibacillus lautus]MEC0201068.1 hypothetical protein [Paenibacillus lautus]
MGNALFLIAHIVGHRHDSPNAKAIPKWPSSSRRSGTAAAEQNKHQGTNEFGSVFFE